MIWNGLLFGIGLILSIFVISFLFELIDFIFTEINDRIEKKKWYEDFNKYNWKNRKKKE